MIVDAFSAPCSARRELLNHVLLVKNFLKNQYASHAVVDEDMEATHGLHYALSVGEGGNGQIEEPCRIMTCSACKFVPFVYDEIRQLIQSSTAHHPLDDKASALDVVNDSEDKMTLFQGHKCRVANQQEGITRVLQAMQSACLERKGSNEALVVFDFKMKFLSKYYREKTTQNFGKRGTTWHGCVVHYYQYEEIIEDSGDVVAAAVKKTIYTDQIVSGSNRQDGEAVAALLDAFFWQLRQELPHIRQIRAQSDNALAYHTRSFLLLAPIIAQNYGLDFVQYIYTETQDGKGLVDAHFSVGARHVDAYIIEGNDAATPLQVRLYFISVLGGASSVRARDSVW